MNEFLIIMAIYSLTVSLLAIYPIIKDWGIFKRITDILLIIYLFFMINVYIVAWFILVPLTLLTFALSPIFYILIPNRETFKLVSWRWSGVFTVVMYDEGIPERFKISLRYKLQKHIETLSERIAERLKEKKEVIQNSYYDERNKIYCSNCKRVVDFSLGKKMGEIQIKAKLVKTEDGKKIKIGELDFPNVECVIEWLSEKYPGIIQSPVKNSALFDYISEALGALYHEFYGQTFSSFNLIVPHHKIFCNSCGAVYDKKDSK